MILLNKKKPNSKENDKRHRRKCHFLKIGVQFIRRLSAHGQSVAHKKRKCKKEKKLKGRPVCHHHIYHGRSDAAGKEKPVIDHCIFLPNPDRDRELPSLPVRFDIADVVDVEYGYRKQATGERGKNFEPRHVPGKQIQGAHHSYDSKKDQHRKITQAGIPIRFLPYSVRNRRQNTEYAQSEKEKKDFHIPAKRY